MGDLVQLPAEELLTPPRSMKLDDKIVLEWKQAPGWALLVFWVWLYFSGGGGVIGPPRDQLHLEEVLAGRPSAYLQTSGDTCRSVYGSSVLSLASANTSCRGVLDGDALVRSGHAMTNDGMSLLPIGLLINGCRGPKPDNVSTWAHQRRARDIT